MDSKDTGGITTSNLIAAIAVVIMAFGAYWALMQSQFENVSKTQETSEQATKDRDDMLLSRIKVLETEARREARDPVEKATLDAIVAAIDKRDDLIQSQIGDLNRQIAAALIIIDSNTTKRPLPP